MKDNLKFTREFSEIIKNSKQKALVSGDPWIYLEHIALSLVEKYCSEETLPFELESIELSYELGGHKPEKIRDSIQKLLNKKQGRSRRLEPVNSSLQFDSEASRVLGYTPDGNIGALDFMISLLESGTELGQMFKSEYSVNLDSLKRSKDTGSAEGLMDNIFNMFKSMTGGDLKMKKLDQDGIQGFKMSFGQTDDDETSEEERLSSEKGIDRDIPFLSKYGRDMIQDAKDGKYDPMVGRETELASLMEILGCRKKNNALLLGDPGTGKTSIIEGLAQKIAASDVPVSLLGKRLFSLDLNSLVAGTKYRGQYEERLQGIIKDVTKNKDIIVYIDEFHNLVGNGSSSGSGDGANILKPYLARGEFQCIGATTTSEYKKIVEKDGALKRRFQNIMVFQPSEEETYQILENIKSTYEEYHSVKFSDDILRECVTLSGRYITDRFFPDKAIDILDMSGARAKLDSGISNSARIKDLKSKLEETKRLKSQAVSVQNFLEAAKYREAEKQLIAELSTESTETVTHDTVAKVIEKLSGVPASKIGQSDMGRLKDMKDVLEKIVIGQPEAIRETVLSLQRNALGLRDPKKPIASLMMIGPTGSGKTYICKTIAKEFFGTDDALIRFDMSEFSEKHEITKLLGSTASYVGYDDEPLFEKVRNRPHCVVLFDEIEKAAPEIYQIFLNILDEGSVTLGNGVKVNFQNAIIIFTGNIGTKELGIQKAGFSGGAIQTKEEIEAITKKALKKTFSPEMINRLSKIIVFNRLTDSDLTEICRLELQKLMTRLSDQGYTLKVSDSVIEKIVSGTDKTYGARDIQRGIVKEVEEPVCDALLTDTTGGKTIIVDKDVISIN